MMYCTNLLLVCLALLFVAAVYCHDEEPAEGNVRQEEVPGDVRQEVADEPDVDPEDLEYQKGSLCGYCTYCKFCRLCEVDCPCEVGPKKPNCHMCKYCKYCYMCRVCDTVCQPGGIIDRVTSRLFNTLPKFNKDEVDKDIDGVKSWIDKTKDEL